MKVLLIGGGAREHAMAEAIVRSGGELHVVMNHVNPGIAKIAESVFKQKETDVAAVMEWAATLAPDVAVIGPEAPEEAGLGDALLAAGIPCASPTKAAARIETDKQFMRELMDKYEVNGRLGFHPFQNADQACAFLDENGPVWAIKPIGLTGGKGVQVYGDHFSDVDGAKAYARSIFASGAGGGELQFEELAVGEEYTVMALTDGTTVLPMVACQDHKRLYDGDKGPNTGGMGSYSQENGLLPFLTESDYNDAVSIVQGIVDALRADGCPYVGAMYGQFMLTRNGPKVIEVNARFGDPEALNVLHLLESDYTDLLVKMASGKLAGETLEFRPAATVVKYCVPEGYGDGTPAVGTPVNIHESILEKTGATIYYASIEDQDGLVTLGSRTLAILGEGPTIAAAEAMAEKGLAAVEGDLVVRHDVGTASLIQQRIDHMNQVRYG